MIHDLTLFGLGLVFAYVLDHYRFARAMRKALEAPRRIFVVTKRRWG